ncbi:hypothetical protein BH20ACT19_BH20ACT19_00790 [soil metagenome]
MREATARHLPDEDRREARSARRLRLVESPAEPERPASGPSRRRSTVEADYAPTYAENGRRTVTITGQPVPARRRRSPAATKVEARPDRIVLWAFLLGLFLVFMAVATANAATL